MAKISDRFILTVSCSVAPGIVAAITGFLADRACSIIEAAQFEDESSGKFFCDWSFR